MSCVLKPPPCAVVEEGSSLLSALQSKASPGLAASLAQYSYDAFK